MTTKIIKHKGKTKALTMTTKIIKKKSVPISFR